MAKKDDALAPKVPADMQKYVGQGTEDMTRDDLQLPRLALAQGLSPQMISSKPEYLEDLKLGQAFNDLTNKIYGNGPWDVAVIRRDPPRHVQFRPREEGGGVIDPNVPPNDPRCQFGPKGEKPVATKFYDYVLVFLDTREMIALSFKSTGIKIAKKFNTLIKLRGPIPLFMGKYTFRTVLVDGPKGSYTQLQITNNGYVTDNELLSFLAAQFDAVKDKPVAFDREPGEDDDVDSPPDAPSEM